MVGKGTYAEFMRSGIDFASLLKKDEEVVEQLSVPGTPNLKSARNRTFSESSVLSQDSSVHSQKDGAVEQPPVSAQSVEVVFNLNFNMGFPCSIGIPGIAELYYQVRVCLWRTCPAMLGWQLTAQHGAVQTQQSQSVQFSISSAGC